MKSAIHSVVATKYRNPLSDPAAAVLLLLSARQKPYGRVRHTLNKEKRWLAACPKDQQMQMQINRADRSNRTETGTETQEQQRTYE